MSWTSKSIKLLVLNALCGIALLAVMGHATGIYSASGIDTLLYAVNGALSSVILMSESIVNMLLEIVAAIIIGVMVAVEGILSAILEMFD